MPITFEAAVATMTGSCTVEEAEPLLEWLRQATEPGVDLSGLATAHGAIVQLLLAASPRILAMPPDPILAAALVAGRSPNTIPPQVTT